METRTYIQESGEKPKKVISSKTALQPEFDPKTEAGKEAKKKLTAAEEEKKLRDQNIEDVTKLLAKINVKFKCTADELKALSPIDFATFNLEIDTLEHNSTLQKEEKTKLQEARKQLRIVQQMANTKRLLDQTLVTIKDIKTDLPNLPSQESLLRLIGSNAQIELGIKLFAGSFVNAKADFDTLKSDLNQELHALMSHSQIQNGLYTEPIFSTLKAYRTKEKPDLISQADIRNQAYLLHTYLISDATLTQSLKNHINDLFFQAQRIEKSNGLPAASKIYAMYVELIGKQPDLAQHIIDQDLSKKLVDEVHVNKFERVSSAIDQLFQTTDPEAIILQFPNIQKNYLEISTSPSPEESAQLASISNNYQKIENVFAILQSAKQIQKILESYEAGTILLPDDQTSIQSNLEIIRRNNPNQANFNFPQLNLQSFIPRLIQQANRKLNPAPNLS